MTRRPKTHPSKTLLAVLVGASCLFPFGVLGVLSGAGRWAFPEPWPASWSWARWGEVVEGGAVGGALVVSLAISTAVATFSTLSGYVTGKYIAGHRHARRLLLLAYVPFALSPVILGVCLLYLYLRMGLVGTIPGVILAQSTFAFAFAIVLFSGFWTPRMRALEDLVRTLGGTTWQVYRDALLPVSRGALVLCFFQTFLLSWFQYGLTLLVGAGRVQTLPVRVFAFVNEANPFYAALAACVLVAPPLALLWVNKRLLFDPDAEEAPAVAHL